MAKNIHTMFLFPKEKVTQDSYIITVDSSRFQQIRRIAQSISRVF